MMFTGFPEATIQFFLDIRFHNSIDYFEENRARYERDVKAPFEAFMNSRPQCSPLTRRWNSAHTAAWRGCGAMCASRRTKAPSATICGYCSAMRANRARAA